MERPKRLIKPNSHYDPNIYVLASFSKKNKHTILPKHRVIIDAIDEQCGTVKSSGFLQSIRIIQEGTQAKFRERSTQFSRDTGSEEVDRQPLNDNEDDEMDENYVYASKSADVQDDAMYHLQIKIDKTKDSTLDFSLISGYKQNSNNQVRITHHDDGQGGALGYIDAPTTTLTQNIVQDKDFSSPAALIIDETLNSNEDMQNSTSVLPEISYRYSDLSASDDDDEYALTATTVKAVQRKRKRASRSTQMKPVENSDTTIINLQKKISLLRHNTNKRLKVLEKTFRILKGRDILRERKDLVNSNDMPLQSPAKPDPEFVVGVDITNFKFAFNEHTRFQTGNAMKKCDQRLRTDVELFEDTWQVVKESVRQLKHDNKRNVMWRNFRNAQNVDNILPQFQANDANPSSRVIAENDENNI
ncbi:unnamed protein product [Adineta ricciae]|uniref:Uncharacterized protein n=1 Tax=Adineta ricciae TaxID=249248 RepID=A0A815NFD4_ADIRI|nr:unnamed protein product [Adineta ricciae]